MNDFRNKILDGLASAYDTAEIPFTEIPESDSAPRTLMVMHEGLSQEGKDAISNLFFTVLPGSDYQELPEDAVRTQLFNIVLQISEEIPPENVENLRLAAQRAGFYLPAGSFAVSEEGEMLVYKYSFLLFEDDGIDKALDQIDTYYGMALGLCSVLMDDLLMAAGGELTADELMDMLKERAGR